jgi:DNA ligase-1
MLEQTAQFPDVVEFLQQAKGPQVESFILDSEIVGYERGEEGEFRLLPFQDLSTRRGNKTDSERIPIRVFAFDLMFLNGKSLVKRPLAERQLLLRENFNIVDGFAFAQSLSLPGFDLTRIMNFLQNAVAGGAEGLMVKLTGERMDYAELNEDTKRTVANDKGVAVCQYESGVRSHTWLKVKRDYVAGFADTIDVVPIGAWYGNGRKAQKGFLSPVLLAVYDEEEDVFRSICRCMSFTDAMYGAMRDFYLRGIPYAEGIGVESDVSPAERTNLKESDVNGENSGNEAVPDDIASDDQDDDASERINCYPSRPSALVVTNESPTIWFKPCEVFEVSFADLTLSRQHSAAAGLVDPIRGVALRFPRFKRRRPDKRIDQATTTVEIARLFEKQAKVQNPKK